MTTFHAAKRQCEEEENDYFALSIRPVCVNRMIQDRERGDDPERGVVEPACQRLKYQEEPARQRYYIKSNPQPVDDIVVHPPTHFYHTHKTITFRSHTSPYCATH